MVECRLVYRDNNDARATFTVRAPSFPMSDITYLQSCAAVVAPLTNAALDGARMYYSWPGVPVGDAGGDMYHALYLYYNPSLPAWEYVLGAVRADAVGRNITYRQDFDPGLAGLADDLAALVYGQGYQLQAVASEGYFW